MQSRDGWCALTLSRPDDIDAVPALVQADAIGDDPWPAVERWVAASDSADVTERCRLLGLPVASLGESASATPRVYRFGAATASRGPSGLLVADLSASGQVRCADICCAGWRDRRQGRKHIPSRRCASRSAGVLRLDERRKALVSGRFRKPSAVLALLAEADVVIESSRPAALNRRGLGRQLFLHATVDLAAHHRSRHRGGTRQLGGVRRRCRGVRWAGVRRR